MKQIVTQLVLVCMLSVGSSTCLMAQTPSAESFLRRVAAKPIGDQAEKDQSSEVFQALNTASQADIEKELPAVIQYLHPDNKAGARAYAAMFLLSIAIRLDGAELLSSKSEEISALIGDADRSVQSAAVAIADYVIAKPGTKRQPYLAAFKASIQSPRTPQDAVIEGMVLPLLVYGVGDPDALKSISAFLNRNDLTATTRMELVHQLGVVPGVPEEVNQYLVKRLDDPDPRVRAMALVSYADSTTVFHNLSKARVERMAKDSKENVQVRNLAKEAIAGKSHLNPNIDMPPDQMNVP